MCSSLQMVLSVTRKAGDFLSTWANISFIDMMLHEANLALGSTQPLTEISTRKISRGVKATGAWGWQSYHFHVSTVFKSGILSLLEPSGPVQACNGIALLLPLHQNYDKREPIFLYGGMAHYRALLFGFETWYFRGRGQPLAQTPTWRTGSPHTHEPRRVAYRWGVGGSNPLPNSEVLTKSNRIANWAENI